MVQEDYHNCAMYILYPGIENGDYMYERTLVREKGSCWIGYHKFGVVDFT